MRFLPSVLWLLLLGFALPERSDWTRWRGPNSDGSLQADQRPNHWPANLVRLWETEVGEGYSGPIASGETVWVHTRRGGEEVVSSLSLLDGKLLWSRAYPVPFKQDPDARGHGQGPYSTPTVADGRLFTLSVTSFLSVWKADSGELWLPKLRPASVMGAFLRWSRPNSSERLLLPPATSTDTEISMYCTASAPCAFPPSSIGGRNGEGSKIMVRATTQRHGCARVLFVAGALLVTSLSVGAQTPDEAKDESKPEVLVNGVDSGAMIALDNKFSEIGGRFENFQESTAAGSSTNDFCWAGVSTEKPRARP